MLKFAGWVTFIVCLMYLGIIMDDRDRGRRQGLAYSAIRRKTFAQLFELALFLVVFWLIAGRIEINFN